MTAETSPFNERVEALAHHERIESEAIGYSGEPSVVYADYEKLVKQASTEELIALVHHSSPVVRGYVGAHLLADLQSDAAYALLSDVTVVDSKSGCSGGNTTVAAHLVSALENALHGAPLRSTAFSKLSALAQRAAADPRSPAAIRRLLLTGMAREGVAGTRSLAVAALADPDPTMISAGLHALYLMGANDVFLEVAPFATHSDRDVRRAAALVLGHCPELAASTLAERMTKDSDASVRDAAEASLARHPSRSPQDLERALNSKRNGDVFAGLSRLANSWAVNLLLGEATRSARAAGALYGLRRNLDPAVVARMTQAASQPGTNEAAKQVREQATRWLARVGA
jgi:hypothetical protein